MSNDAQECLDEAVAKLHRYKVTVADIERKLRDEEYDHDKTRDKLKQALSDLEDRERRIASLERDLADAGYTLRNSGW